MQHPLLQPLVRSEAEIGLDRHRRWASGSPAACGLPSSSTRLQRLAISSRVGHRRWHVGEQLLHLRRRLEILLARELAHAPLVAQDLALGDADARLVRLVVVCAEELHRMGRHHRQLQARSQLHRRRHMRLVVGAAGALQLQVEAVRKDRRQRQRHFAARAARRPAPAPGPPARPARPTARSGLRPVRAATRACTRPAPCTTLRVQARASSSHRFR